MKYTFKPITELKVVILDHSNYYRSYIINSLKEYKSRWGESIADNLLVVTTPAEVPPGIPVIVTQYFYDELPSLLAGAIPVDSMQFITKEHLRQAVLVTSYEYTKCHIEAQAMLDKLGPIVAYDCETASNYSKEETEALLKEAEECETLECKQPLLSKASSNALVAQKNQFTMFSFADNETDAIVIDANAETIPVVFNYLLTTNSKLVVHNTLFDLKLVHWHTKQFPKDYEDTQLMWATILNHVDTYKAKVGLKGLAGVVYSEWGVSKDLFGIEHKYNPELIKYAGIDPCATMYVYNEALAHPDFQWKKGEKKIPITDILPIAHPSEVANRSSRRFFYENVLKSLIPSMIQMMNNGIHMDMDKVYKLDAKLDVILQEVEDTLLANEYIKNFNTFRYKVFKSDYAEDRRSKMRTVNEYIKPFKPGDMVHRSYFLNYIDLGVMYEPEGNLPNGELKWTVKDVKALIKLVDDDLVKVLEAIVDKTYKSQAADEAMIKLATDKATAYNASYLLDIENVSVEDLPKFKASSSKLKGELFRFLGVPCEAQTKEGADSWVREELERVFYETQDPILKDLLDALIKHSQGNIVKTNFVKGFINYPIDEVMYGSIKLMGTKTARPTSGGKGSVNFLNMPSTGSVYSKPIKECMDARPGYVVMSSDYAALEDRVLANITKDEGKLKLLHVYPDGSMFDGHCFNASGYFKDKIEAILGPVDKSIEFNKKFKAACKTNNELAEIRQDSKGPTFGLAYGAMAPKVASSIGCSLKVAEAIYNSYHFELYNGVRTYIDDYVLKESKKNKEMYCMLGLHIRTDNPSKDIRTLHNSTIQSFSILTLIALAKMQERINEAGYQEEVIITNTIYDAIYLDVKDDKFFTDWVNKNLIECMLQPYLKEELVPNDADCDIGTSLMDQKGYN